MDKKRKRVHNKEDEHNENDNPVKKELSRWKKRSIFFDLPYWEVSVYFFPTLIKQKNV